MSSFRKHLPLGRPDLGPRTDSPRGWSQARTPHRTPAAWPGDAGPDPPGAYRVPPLPVCHMWAPGHPSPTQGSTHHAQAHRGGGDPNAVAHYQVPVDAAEEGVRLDVGKSSLWPAAEPLFGVLRVRVQMRTGQHRSWPAARPAFSKLPALPASSLGLRCDPLGLFCGCGQSRRLPPTRRGPRARE